MSISKVWLLMNAPNDGFADQIYIDIDVECTICHLSFVGAKLDADTEKDIRRWANETAVAARKANWRMDSQGNICCPDCYRKTHPN